MGETRVDADSFQAALETKELVTVHESGGAVRHGVVLEGTHPTKHH